MEKSLSAAAPAKINWGLDITGIREDGYHLVDLLMQTVSLSDILTVIPNETLSLTLSGELPFSEDNLVLQAARLLRKVTGCTKGAQIHLDKHIPFGAGLGGGSSDAACALTLLNQFWELGLQKKELHAIAACLGADVPFFLYGGLARCTGIGTELETLPLPSTWYLTLVQPEAVSHTGQVYKAFDRLCPEEIRHPDSEGILRILHMPPDASLLSELAASMENVLTAPAVHLYPEIGICLSAMQATGSVCNAMTGSGSVIFSVHTTPEDAEACANKMRNAGYRNVYTCVTQ